MPSNLTIIPAPRVPLIYGDTGLITTEWYRFLFNLYVLSGSGSNPTSLDELQLGPPPQPVSATGGGGVGTVTSIDTGTGLSGGPITTTGTINFAVAAVGTWAGTPSSANLAAAMTDETGTGALVFANTPTLVSPILGTPTSGNFSSGTFTWPTFNQNTTGYAASLAGGSAGALPYQSALNTTTFLAAGTNGQVLTLASGVPSWATPTIGDVVGPASATDNAIARFDTTTGKLIQNSVVTIDDAGNEAGINSIGFDITPTTVPTAPGSLYWDSADGNQTLSLVMANGDAIQQIGQEQYFRIKASAPITEGQVVMFTGTVGASGALTGAPASGLTATTASYVMGIATHNLATNDWGYITSFGLVRQINTTGGAEAWVDGQILYYDPTVAGGLTKTVPVAPNAKIQVCAVVHAASNGSVFVRPTFGGALGQYEGDVQVTTPANGDLLIRNQTTGEWVNAPLTAGTAISVTNTAGAVTVTNTAPDQIVSIASGTGISATGTYPNFTVTNTAPDQTVALANGTGISVTGTYPNFTITNTAPSSGGTVTSVTATAPIASTGGTTPVISMPAATGSVNGYLTSTDWTTFNSKQAALISGSNIKTVGGNSLLGSGDVGTIGIAYGGTGQTTASAAFNALSPITTAGDLIIGNGTNSATRLGIGSTGQVLTVVAGAPAWAAASSGNITTYGLWENSKTISANYTIGTGNNALSAGPITIASGVSVTVPSGSRWVVA